MRYYRVELTNSKTGKPILDAQGKPIGPFTSFVNGQTIPGALNIEFDIPAAPFAQPMGSAYLKLWGVGLGSIGYASMFNPDWVNGSFTRIKVYGGMQAGLPLANPKQAGLLIDGFVLQAFGNWQGTQQSLDFVVNGIFGAPDEPANIVLNWQKGQPLGPAVALALQNAFPKRTVTGSVATTLVAPQDQPSYYQSVPQLAAYVAGVSQVMVGGTYRGVQIAATEAGFKLFDGTSKTAPKQINFTDLIGQPTWLDIGTINFKTVMRSDIAMSDYVKMPPVPQISTAASYSSYRDKAVFNGVFLVNSVRHMGHFRQRSADSWVTSIDAVIQPNV